MGKPVGVPIPVIIIILEVGNTVIVIIRVVDVIPESIPIRIFLEIDVLVVNLVILFHLFLPLHHILILVFIIIPHLIYTFKPYLILPRPRRMLMPPSTKDKAEECEGDEAESPRTQRAPVAKTPGPHASLAHPM